MFSMEALEVTAYIVGPALPILFIWAYLAR